MKKLLTALAVVTSSVAIVLALDLGGLKFREIDIGDGHRLRMLISGHGNPPVVFETGGSPANGGPLESWERVQPAVSKFTTTVSYDRAGIGRSEPGAKPRDARRVAQELHTALGNAGIRPPYILVGHSLGGPYIRVFADLYPDDVSGMVLVDPTQEEAIEWSKAHDTNYVERTGEEWKEMTASLREAHESVVPPGIPVVLITAMGPQTFPGSWTEKQKQEYKEGHKRWLQFHSDWLEKLPGGKHIITEKSGHMVPFTEPELIVNAIRQMVKGSD
jgi:pimeloyl-ACP methyl ester carboxylesterase